MEWIGRERLLAALRRRHEVDLVVMEAPAGSGRTVLIEQALAEGPRRPGDRDVRIVLHPGLSDADAVAGEVVRALGGDPARRDRAADTAGASGAVVAALAEAARAGGQVALLVDDVDRCPPEAGRLWVDIADRLPTGTHLLLSGRVLPPIGLARRAATGKALILGADDLSFTRDELAELATAWPALATADPAVATWPALAGLVVNGHPELAADFLAEAVLPQVAPDAARLLAVAAAVGGCPDDLVGDVLEAVDGAAAPGAADLRALRALVAAVRALPLVSGATTLRPHPLWVEATRPLLGPRARVRAVSAACRSLLAQGAVHEAGDLAERSGSADALALVVRSALSIQPTGATASDLRRWAESGVLPVGSAELLWLEATIRLQSGDVDGRALATLEEVQRRYEEHGDDAGEVGVLLHLGDLARARSDAAAMARLLGRAEILAARGHPRARGLVALGQAVTRQLSDDPTGALQALDAVPAGSLVGEWAAQLQMVRGTNLLLAGRTDAAVASLEMATGDGSEGSRAVAHDLLALARWLAADPAGGVADAEEADRLARSAGSPAISRRARATKAHFLALAGQRSRVDSILGDLQQVPGAPDDEATTLVALTEALLMAEDGNWVAARVLASTTPAATRTARSSVWKASLTALLGVEPEAASGAPGGNDRRSRLTGGLAAATTAGRLGAHRVAGGPPAPAWCRSFVPFRWCEAGPSRLAIALLGTGSVRRDLDQVDHPAWARTRVRELCLHLALVDDRDRAGVAAALWPDRSDRAAGQNLRVTLAHLLDVLDPDRDASDGIMVDERGGFRFRRDGRLSVDLWDVVREAEAVLATSGHERSPLLAHARALLARGSGPVLGGQAVGDWFDPYRRRYEDVVVAAAHAAAPVALGAGDPELVEALARRALEVDPWSERSHRLVVEARIVGDDPDGVRRAVEDLLAVSGELGVPPAPETSDLVSRAMGTNW